MAVHAPDDAMPKHRQGRHNPTIMEELHKSLKLEEDEQMVGLEYNTRIIIAELWE